MGRSIKVRGRHLNSAGVATSNQYKPTDITTIPLIVDCLQENGINYLKRGPKGQVRIY